MKRSASAPFFSTKAIRENPHRWTWGRGMMDGTDVYFSPWGLQSGSICGTVPQFCKTSPRNRSVFGRKKTSSQRLWVHSQHAIHFLEIQHSTLINRSWKTSSYFLARRNQVSCYFERLYHFWSPEKCRQIGIVHQFIVLSLSTRCLETFLHPKWCRIFPHQASRSIQVPLATTTWLSL